MSSRNWSNDTPKAVVQVLEMQVPARRLAEGNFEIAVTIALEDAVAQKAAQASLATLKDNPGAIGTIFNAKYLTLCGDSCEGVPKSWEASSPSVTQVYLLAKDIASRRNTTTSTLPP